MTKIMLVEDDKSLREIYGVRLLAEGYDIVSAGDGEEALAVAIKERPELVVSDVMMPKISGFDMLDILRSTTETKNIKVIMMTALSSEEQRQRGESLGADKYLVKSQVGIEDVVRTVHEVLGDKPTAAPAAPAAPVPPANPAPAPQAAPQPAPAPAPAPPPVSPAPAPQPAPAQPQPVQPVQPTPPPPASPPTAPPSPAAAPIPQTPQPNTDTPKPASLKNRIIQPINDPSAEPVNMGELLDQELAKEAGLSEDDRPQVASTEQEKQSVEQQLDQIMTDPNNNSDSDDQTNSDGSIVAGPNVEPPFQNDDQSNSSTTPPPPPPPPGAPTA
ncbi:MAG TPA: response regulator [Candidatus Saccharimonadales bacterium]|nr:response regulator [Candidatus Saccharimonadales bacterium]